jgi:hypothetical protein
VKVAVEALGPEPVKSLSTVVTVTATLAPITPGGAVTVTWLVSPQSRKAWTLENLTAATLPKNTPVTQPRFSPLMVTAVPPGAGPDVGDAESTFGSPGGKRRKKSAGGFNEQPETVHASTSTTAGFCGTVVVVMLVSPTIV